MSEAAKKQTVFFDCETGGLELTHPILQIAAVAVDAEWKELGTFERKIIVDTEKCTAKALEINSYDKELWEKEAMPERAVVSQFKSFLDKYCSVDLISARTGNSYSVARVGGHNVRFDIDHVKFVFKRYGEFFPIQLNNPLDTLQGAVWYFEKTGKEPPENYQLATIAKYFGIEVTGAHDALVDTRLTVKLARIFLEETS